MDVVRMEIVRNLLLLLHLIGFASLFGGFLVQARVRHPEINAAMLHGSLTALLTGVLLAAWHVIAGERLDHLQIGLKLGISVVAVFLVVINRRFTSVPKGLWALIGLLTLASAAIAVLWR